MSWRRILLFTLVFAMLLGIGTWALLQRTEAITAFVQEQLTQHLRPRATLERASVDAVRGRVTFEGLRIEDPVRPDKLLLTIDRADCDVELNPLGDLLSIHQVEIDGLHLDLDAALPSPEQLLRGDTDRANATADALVIPPIRLQRGEVRFALRPDTAPVIVRDLALQALPVRGAAGKLALSGTGRLGDLDATVHLTGSADTRAGAISVSLSLADVPLDAKTWARLQELFDIPLTGLQADCVMRELTAHISIGRHGEGDELPHFEVRGRLEHVNASVPELDYPLRDAVVRFSASDLGGGTATVHLDQKTGAGEVSVRAQARLVDGKPDLELRVGGRDIVIDAAVLGLLNSIPVGRRVIAALQPTSGRADLELYLHNPHESGGTAELDLDLRDVAMAYHGFGDPSWRIGFPLPLTEAKGHVRLRDDVVDLQGVEAKIAGSDGGVVRLTGKVDTRKGGGEEATLDVVAQAVPFDARLREALTTLLHDDGALYDRLAPEGLADVEVLVRPRSVLAGGWSVNVKLRDGAMRWAGFPYRLQQVRGDVIARDAGINFDLEGRHGDGVLTMQGRIPLASTAVGRLAGFEALIRLRDVEIDDELRAAVAVVVPEVDAPWRACQPRGRLGGEVRVWRPAPEDPLHHDLRIDCDGVRLALPAAPWVAEDLHGQVFAQGEGSNTRIDFDALRGRLGHGVGSVSQLAMLGSISSGPELRTDLTFVVRDLGLDDQLGVTLEELGALGPGTWAALQPSGATDLVCRHRYPADDGSPLQLVVQLLDVASNAPMLPKPARRMTGELTIAGGELRFEDVRADIGGAEVRATAGVVRTMPAPDPRTEIAFTVTSNSFPIDSGLANLFTEPLHSAIAERELSGRADLNELQLRFLLPTEATNLPFETTIGGQLRLNGIGLTFGEGHDTLRIDDITGYVRLQESVVTASGGGLRGTMQGCSLLLMRHRLEALSAGFTADAERLVVHSLSAGLDGGLVRNTADDSVALDYTLPGTVAPQGRLRGNLTFDRVDVYTFLDQSGWTNPPYSGTASGSFVLDSLDGSDLVGATGSGVMSIERGDLGGVPLFTAIYAQLPAPERPRFDRLHSRFSLANRRLQLDELSLWSNLLAAHGKGTMDLDGYLDIELKLDNLLGPSADPLLMPLVTFFAQNIVRFHLFGHLRDLQAEKRWVTERSPRRRAVLPMPPHRERSELPDYE